MDTLTKPGYKQTELGWIPEDWELIKIDQIASKVGSGITPSGGQKVYKTEGRPFVRSQNVGWGKLILGDIAFIDDETHSRFDSTEINENDVLLNITGASIGRSAVVKTELVGGNVNQHVCIIRPNLIRIKSKYLNCLILSSLGQRQINNFQAGGNREGLNFYQVKSLKFPIPPIKEQTAISTALSDMDSYISSLEKLITKKRMIKQGAMQELLTPKEDWEVRKLGDCLNSNPSYGINAAACDYSDILPAYLRITDISEQGEYLSESKVSVNHPLSQDYFLEVGDLVVARTGASVGKTYLYNEADGRLVFAGFLIRLRPNTKMLNPFFLKYITETREYWNWISVMSMRSGQPGINGQEIKSFEIILPKIARQNEISELLFSIDKEIIALQKKLIKCQQLKQGMMQELLTGKVRLV